MGSWRTFYVDADVEAVAIRTAIPRTSFNAGGRLIDSSPIYGTSQAVIGAALRSIGEAADCFAADRVWTPGGESGVAQNERSRGRWGVERFDLLQVHYLVEWRRHLDLPFGMRNEGGCGMSASRPMRAFDTPESKRFVTGEPIDFLQLTCDIADRDAEARLLPLSDERGVAVTANRPFREGGLFPIVEGTPLPALASEIGAASWAQFMLKSVISRPALTGAIPATRRIDHMSENEAALEGPFPDSAP